MNKKTSAGRSFYDQTGRCITLHRSPRSIVSLVPSQTELLFDLGVAERIAGVTSFCIHPREECARRRIIGGPKTVDMAAIHALDPDLIIANTEENDKDQITALSRKYPVWLSDIETVEGALDMIRDVGDIVGAEQIADALVRDVKRNIYSFEPLNLSALYVIWKEPLMTAGGKTFIDAMLTLCGFENAVNDIPRYPAVDDEEVKRLNPAVIFLSSEPYPFTDVDVDEFERRFPGRMIMPVDGEIFSWYGSRLRHAAPYFETLRTQVISRFTETAGNNPV